MSTTASRAASQPRTPTTTSRRERARKILLACGPLSALAYVGWHELAALRWEHYSRISNAISELHLTGTPSKSFLDPWQGLVDNALLAAFGVGILLSARGRRPLQVVGALMLLPAATNPLWMIFGEASLAAHIILVLVGIGTWLGAMGFGAAAFGRRFRVYTLATLATVIAFSALALSYAPAVNAGQPTPFIGLEERIAFSAYYLWQFVFAAALWRARPPVRAGVVSARREGRVAAPAHR